MNEESIICKLYDGLTQRLIIYSLKLLVFNIKTQAGLKVIIKLG